MSDKDTKASSGYLNIFETQDPEKLASAIESYYDKDVNTKVSLAYHWQRNQLMVDGSHWLYYDKSASNNGSGTWKPIPQSQGNEWVPRPVTNYMFDSYQTLKSYLVQNRPQMNVEPNTQLWSDKEAAKLATLVSDATWSRLKENQNYEYAASCGVMYGTVFKKDYWDTNTVATAEIPKEAMGMAPSPEDPSPTVSVPVGDINTAIVEPFRIAMDPMATDLHTARWIMEFSIQPLEWVKATYGKQAPGYTGEAENLESESKLNSSLDRFTKLKNSSGVQNSSFGGGEDATMPPNSVVIKEYYERPTAASPKGRMVVVANKKTLYIAESPYSGDDASDWHPYSEFRWEIVPGRFWGKSPLDAVSELNRRINSIDSAVILSRKSMANPKWVVSKDSGVNIGNLNGKPGLIVQKRAGSEVTQLPGIAMDNQVFKEREQSKADIDLISGAMNILKGDTPGSVTAASALEMLFEVGLGKLRPSLDRWKWFIESSQRKQLKLIHDNYKEQRPAFTKLLIRKNKELSVDAINAFLGSSLSEAYNVVIEAGSHIPKLQSSQRSLLLEMAQRGVLGLDNPENQSEFNKRFGIIGFDNTVGPDLNRSKWENDCVENIMQNPNGKPTVLLEDNHDLHLQEHWNLAKAPRFHDLQPAVQNALFAHIQEHDNMKMQKMQEQMMQQGMMAPAGAMQPEGHPAPASNPHGMHQGKIGASSHEDKAAMQAITGGTPKIL